MLVDGPVIAGEYLKVVALSTENPPAEIDVVADSAAALDAPEDVWEHLRDLVKQAVILFSARHHAGYHFLLALSDHVAPFGFVADESNESRVQERTPVQDYSTKLHANLLPDH